VHSRVGWIIVLTFLGVLIGANVFAGTFGTSPCDPEGTAMPAGGLCRFVLWDSFVLAHTPDSKKRFREFTGRMIVSIRLRRFFRTTGQKCELIDYDFVCLVRLFHEFQSFRPRRSSSLREKLDGAE
jgi:hypothetical protein